MKRSIFFIAFFLFLICGWVSAAEEIVLVKNPPPDPPPSTLTFELPVSATISETQLAVYFDSSVGDATITVYDASNQVVYQETVDTNSTSEVYISSGTWASGNYTITISYDTTNLIGEFQTE